MKVIRTLRLEARDLIETETPKARTLRRPLPPVLQPGRDGKIRELSLKDPTFKLKIHLY